MEEEEACSVVVSNEEEVGVALLTDSAPFCMWEGSKTDCRGSNSQLCGVCVCVWGGGGGGGVDAPLLCGPAKAALPN